MKIIKNKKNHKISFLSFLISILIIALVGFIFIGISYRNLTNNKDEKGLETFVAGTDSSYIRLGLENGEIKVGENNKLIIYLENPGGDKIDSVGVVLSFDPSKIEFSSLEKGNVFDSNRNEINDNLIEFSFYPSDPGLGGLFEGDSGILGKINFKLKEDSETKIEIKCGSLLDSSINYNGKNLINCGQNKSISLKVSEENNEPEEDDNGEEGNDDEGDNGGDNNNQNVGGGSNFSPSKPAECKSSFPQRPSNVKAVSGPGSNQVTLTWNASSPVTHYGITFGRKWIDNAGPNEYGATNIGNVTKYVVNGLTPGQLYYFVVYANNDCANSGYSNGANAYAGIYRGNYGVGTPTPKSTPRPTITPIPTPTQIATPSSTPIYEPIATLAPIDNEEDIESEEKGFLGLDTSSILPIIGGILLVILGILFVVLVKYLKRDEEIEEIIQENQEE